MGGALGPTHHHLQGDKMRFNPKARLDTSRTSGGGGGGGFGGGGGGRIPIPGGRAGGGIGTVILLLVFFLVTQCMGVGPQVLGDSGSSTSVGTGTFGGLQAAEAGETGDFGACRTGEDANNDENCAFVALENSMTGYWDSQPDLSGRFQP